MGTSMRRSFRTHVCYLTHTQFPYPVPIPSSHTQFPYPGRCPGLVCPAPLGRWFVPTGHRIPEVQRPGFCWGDGLSQRDTAYQRRVQPWEPCHANPRVLKERCISPNGEPAPDLTRCGVPSEPMYVILSIPSSHTQGVAQGWYAPPRWGDSLSQRDTAYQKGNALDSLTQRV